MSNYQERIKIERTSTLGRGGRAKLQRSIPAADRSIQVGGSTGHQVLPMGGSDDYIHKPWRRDPFTTPHGDPKELNFDSD